jgi:2'-5' RNA ligase
MTRSPQPRLFIAVPVPADVEAAITSVVERVRSAATPAEGATSDGSGSTASISRSVSFGPTPADRVEATTAATALGGQRPVQRFDVVLGRAGAFPNGKRPRALWVDVLHGADELAAVAGRGRWASCATAAGPSTIARSEPT